MTDVPDRLASALEGRYRIEREVAVKVPRPELAAVIGAERFLSRLVAVGHNLYL